MARSPADIFFRKLRLAGISRPAVEALADRFAALESGGSSAGAPVVRKFPFAYNTSGLVTGHTVYTPTAGDILLDAWIEIDTAWDGTTPKGDVGQFLSPDNYGWYGSLTNPIDMTGADSADEAVAAEGLLTATNGSQGLYGVTVAASTGTSSRVLPAKLTADPIKVVVSQNGHNDGADPASTQGAAILYLVTATPA